MKLNKLFKLLIDLAFYIMIPFVIFFPGTILYILLFPEQTIIDNNLPFASTDSGLATALTSLVVFARVILFFIGFYNLRKFAVLLVVNKIFSNKVILHTKKTGQFFTACSILSIILSIIPFISTSYTNNMDELPTSFKFSFLPYFLLIIGVLFLLLSDAFKKTLALKEENDLTV